MPEKNPWKKVSSKLAYENPWISVVHNEVIQPDGKEGIYGQVDFKNLAVGIIPLDKDLNTWLVGQYRFVIDQYSWEIPMGGCPRGTNPEETAHRELREETGILCQRLEKIMEVHLSNAVCNEKGIAYIARDLTFGESEPDGTEQIRTKKLPFHDVYNMVLRGEITDALSCCAILKAKVLLANV